MANSNYSTLIARNKKTYGDNGPKSMADFFDVKKFPGKRALWNQPVGMIEAAALALGTPRDKVYEFLSTEEGRKASIAKLTELAPSVSVWWESGAQAAQLIKDGEVDMIITGRSRTGCDQRWCELCLHLQRRAARYRRLCRCERRSASRCSHALFEGNV